MSAKPIRKQRTAETKTLRDRTVSLGEATDELLLIFENTEEIDKIGQLWRNENSLLDYLIEVVKLNYMDMRADTPDKIKAAKEVTKDLRYIFERCEQSILERKAAAAKKDEEQPSATPSEPTPDSSLPSVGHPLY